MIAAAVAVIVPFTGLAWPLALLVGLVISSDERDRKRGVGTPQATRIVRVLAVTGGVLGMMFAGAVLGGLIAFTIAWLTTVSERMAADAMPIDRTMARLLLVVGGFVGFFLVSALVRPVFSVVVGS